MANITTGLTKNSGGNEGVTTHYAFSFDLAVSVRATTPKKSGG